MTSTSATNLVFGHRVLITLADAEYSQIKDWDGKQLFWLNRKLICPFQSTCQTCTVLFPYDSVRGKESVTLEMEESAGTSTARRVQYVCVPLFKKLEESK
ncbi:MAG: hypothetical protein K1X28_10930 [Parachlamydiales bacterium]|nr:hypothetical protein [Parachlamydiales bacterium]